jgi:LysM repeat protein
MSLQFRLVLTVFVSFLAISILGACQAQQVVPTSTDGSGQITPYWTATPSPTTTPLEPAGSFTATTIPATIPPPPTPTPFTYVIEKGDTMGVIAYRFGVTVADLKAANPEVDPNLMSVGTALVIPIVEKNESGTPEALATPTPIPIEISQPDCFPLASGGAWCLALAHNNLSQPVESLIAWIQFVSPNGQVLAGQQAVPPLNLLPAGQNLPVMAFFPDGTSTDSSPQIELISALPIPSGDRRYFPTDLQVESTEIDPNGLQATVRGRLTLLALPSPTPSGEKPEQNAAENTPTPTAGGATIENDHASQIWLAVTAYDSENVPVGVRKWETNLDLSPGTTLPFEVNVFSLGPEIVRVEVLVEAHP